MLLVVWYDNGMKRRIFLPALLVLVGSIASLIIMGGGVAHAQGGGGVGSGGSGSGGSGGAQSRHGWGWRLYDASGAGPSGGFKSGSWSAAKAACTGYSSNVAVFVINTAPGATQKQVGYDYHTIYFSPSIFSGYQTSSPYIPVPTAKTNYDLLPASVRSGHTWGSDVGWFCYGIVPPTDVCPNLAGAQATVPSGYTKDGSGNCVIPDGAPTINVDTINCIAATISGVAIDGDWSGEIDVHIYVGGPPGSGAPGYSRTTSGHRFTFVDPNPNPMRISGQRYYLYAIGVNSSGAANGNNVAFGGNPVSMGPCNSATCTIDTFPAQMLVGDGNQFTVSMRVSYWGAPLAVGNPALTVQVRDPNGVITTSTPSYTVSGSSPATLTSDPIGFNSNIPGTYQMQWSLAGGGLNTLCPGGNNGSWSNPRIGNAAYKPYFNVNGGDILSGASITAWNAGSGGGFAGAGSQLAAFAGGNISGFITGSGLGSVGNGTRLAFANTATNPANGIYGGGFGVTHYAPASSGGELWSGGSTIDLSTLSTSKVYHITTGVTLSGTVPAGVNIVLNVTGNVYIQDNIGYGSYTTAQEVPRLTVNAGGNIYVKNTVTTMRGIYYTAAKFYSCSSGLGSPVSLGSATGYTDCNHQLTVYGAVVADKMILSRTYGNLRAVPGVPAQAAENFVYSPELWLAPSGAASGNSSPQFDLYQSLPPVL